MTWLLLLLLLMLVTFSCAAVIPSRMEGRFLPDDIHVVRLIVGSTGNIKRFALDFSSRYVRIRKPLPSSTHSHTAGGTDVIHVGYRRLRLPMRLDPEAPARLGCPTCDGTLGVGAGSPLWLFYGSATFTAGSVLLGTAPPPIRDTAGTYAPCLGPHPSLCLTRAEVYGHRYIVDLGFQTPETLVPMEVYERFTGLRNVGQDPPHRWEPLRLHFEGDPGTEVSISSHNLVATERHGMRRLMLGLSPRNDTIYLGRTAFWSLMIHRDFLGGKVKVIQWEARKHRSASSLLLVVILSFIFMHWKLTRDGMLPSPSGIPRLHLYPDRLVLELIGGGLIVMAYYLPQIRDAVRINPTFDGFIFFAILTMFTWEALALAIYWWDASVMVGDIFVRKPKTEKTSEPPAVEGEIPASHNPNLRHRPVVSPFTKTGATWRDLGPRVRRIGRHLAPIGLSHFPVRSRIALVRQISHELALLFAILILTTEARTDSFAVALSAIFSLVLTFFLIYHLIVTVYHLWGYDRIGIWVLFTGTIAVLSLVTVILTYSEIVRPYFERRLFTAIWLINIFVVLVYMATVLGAASVADRQIRKDRAFFHSLAVEPLIPDPQTEPYTS